MLEIKHLYKYYQNECVLNDMNASFKDHGFIGITGESGCGKSTLLRILSSVDNDYTRTLYFKNKPIQDLHHVCTLSYIFQDFQLINYLSIKDNISLYHFFHKAIYHTTYDIKHKHIQELSLGQRQKVAIERSLSYQPDIILCDEPTAYLDEKSSHELMKQLKEISQYALVLFVSHDISLLETYCDDIWNIEEGDFHQKEISSKKQYPKYDILKKIFFKIPIQSMTYYSSLFIKMIMSMQIALLVLFTTISFFTSFQSQFLNYLHTLFPESTISMKTDKKVDFQESFIKHVHYYSKDVEDLGLSFEEKYHSNHSLTIINDSDYSDNLLLGKKPSNDYEIVLSYKTATLLSQDIHALIGRHIYIHYKYHKKVYPIDMIITGINYHQDISYSLKQYANISHYQTFKDSSIDYGILYVDDLNDNYQYLKAHYPNVSFKIVGEETYHHTQTLLKRITYILYLFTSMISIIIFYLLVSFINIYVSIINKDKMILKQYGCRKKHIIIWMMSVFSLIHIYSFISSYISFSYLLNIINNYLGQILINQSFIISLDIQYVFIIGISTYILLQLISLFRIINS